MFDKVYCYNCFNINISNPLALEVCSFQALKIVIFLSSVLLVLYNLLLNEMNETYWPEEGSNLRSPADCTTAPGPKPSHLRDWYLWQ